MRLDDEIFRLVSITDGMKDANENVAGKGFFKVCHSHDSINQ